MKAAPSSHLSDLIQSFLESLDINATSVRTYKEALKNFVAWRNGQPPEAPVTAGEIKLYKEWLRQNRAANTVATYLVALRRFFQYCVSEGVYSENPVEKVKNIRRPRGHLRQDISREGLRRLFSVVDRSTLMGKRDFAIMSLMARNGLRVIEVTRANVGDLEYRRGRQILRIWGKGRDERDEFVVLSEPTVSALEDYLQARGEANPQEPLFVGVRARNKGRRLTTRQINRIVNRYLIKAGLKNEKISPHSLRHSFVTLAIQSGASIIEAQIAARHKSIETTRVYFHEHDRLESPPEDKIEI
ncbi:MAG: site-specific integrase [Candidatus Bipolaricaulota bacterium]|nr:site-specific integrase [Candidatus Bipolaricaulota bacterium]MCS7274467.1 site-specific integrase [Candidatus Bipolaricaulota bacterium]MDW8110896.1 tyrosine-type recombinase/integrase [Candidatus Bipolaricaulota bacterium]MDW8329337.1 tyrosine-type recombinase/integrase [Candidatus Bipolaricaulota bacterium]